MSDARELIVAARRVEAACWDGAADRAPLVLLHEGLGSIALWGTFPEALAAATGRRVLAFSARYHANVDAAFSGWADVWLHPDFERWELSEEITRLRAPTLLIQGINDQYATLEQLDRIQNDAAAPIQRLELRCQHSPHLEAPDETLTAIATFATALG